MAIPIKNRIHLPSVTLCAVTSTNTGATVEAIHGCVKHIEFGDAVLFTDVLPAVTVTTRASPIRVVEIPRLDTSEEYSNFILRHLVDYISTEHCMIVQWDGHIIDPTRWREEFLNYDYIGARWPQFNDGKDVGNGGFSLRTKRLMELCRQPTFVPHHPEDVAVCRTNRALMESNGMRFAPARLADAFSAERTGDPTRSFGYHGVFLMPKVLGPDKFWSIYRDLDTRMILWRDLWPIAKSLRSGKNSILRSVQLFVTRLVNSGRRLF